MIEESKHSTEDAGEQAETDMAENGESNTEELTARISQLEETVLSKDNELSMLKGSLAEAVSKYRAAVISAATDVPGELVKGETLEEVDLSLQAARDIVARVRQQVEAGQTAAAVPAGAPPRRQPDLSELSPAAKISHALIRQG